MDTAREEIISSSQASKQLGEVLNQVKQKRRIVLSRNNRLEAVILPIEEYEEIADDEDLRQLFKQCFGFFQVCRIKPFGEPAIDLGQHLAGFCCLALLLPQTAQAHHRPQL